MDATLSDVLNFIASARSEADMDAISNACSKRMGTLRNARASALREGVQVELKEISPKYLIGLTGVVIRVGGNRCSVTLDKRSTDLLRVKGNRRYYIGSDVDEHTLDGVPAACCTPVAVPAGS